MMLSVYLMLFLAFGATGPDRIIDDPFWKWPLSKAVQILNSSAWARQETFTTVVGGVGSGRSGEKEIYNRFYVRFLSARPVREAYARILQIQSGYDNLREDEQVRFDKLLQPGLEMETAQWIVVSISFRSNDPDQESQMRRYFLSETTATLKDKTFLSTAQFPQVKLHSFFPPLEESVGARFVFPREIGGQPLVSEAAGDIVFEMLEIPVLKATGRGGDGNRSSRGGRGRSGGRSGRGRDNDSNSNADSDRSPVLIATFSIEEMVVDGEIIL